MSNKICLFSFHRRTQLPYEDSLRRDKLINLCYKSVIGVSSLCGPWQKSAPRVRGSVTRSTECKKDTLCIDDGIESGAMTRHELVSKTKKNSLKIEFQVRKHVFVLIMYNITDV